MRKLIAFVFASALLGAGLYLLFLQLFVTSHLVGQALDAAGLLITLGAAWLWTDFIAHVVRRGDGEISRAASQNPKALVAATHGLHVAAHGTCAYEFLSAQSLGQPLPYFTVAASPI